MSQSLVTEVMVKGHLPPLLSPTERQLLEQIREAVQIVRHYWGGTGKVTLTVDLKEGRVMGVRKGLEGPQERL